MGVCEGTVARVFHKSELPLILAFPSSSLLLLTDDFFAVTEWCEVHNGCAAESNLPAPYWYYR